MDLGVDSTLAHPGLVALTTKGYRESMTDVRSTILSFPTRSSWRQVIILLVASPGMNGMNGLLSGGIRLLANTSTVLMLRLLVLDLSSMRREDVPDMRSRRTRGTGHGPMRVSVDTLEGVVEGLEMVVGIRRQRVVRFLQESG